MFDRAVEVALYAIIGNFLDSARKKPNYKIPFVRIGVFIVVFLHECLTTVLSRSVWKIEFSLKRLQNNMPLVI